MKFLDNKKLLIGILVTVFAFVCCGIIYFTIVNSKDDLAEVDNDLNSFVEPTDDVSNLWYVEVKGAVKNPGVYATGAGAIINDIIKLAGGFTKSAYTKNINLSKRVKDEMVIYVFTTSEYKKNSIVKSSDNCLSNGQVIDNCTNNNESIINSGEEQNDANNSNTKININLASLSELSQLPGLGEKKAQAIIDYRSKNGNFKSIEEIKNVSGIGDTTYEKLKELIMV